MSSSSSSTVGLLQALAYQQAHINEDRGPALAAAFIVLMTLATLAVILRLLARRLIKAPLKADDWTMVLSLVSSYMLGCEGSRLHDAQR